MTAPIDARSQTPPDLVTRGADLCTSRMLRFPIPDPLDGVEKSGMIPLETNDQLERGFGVDQERRGVLYLGGTIDLDGTFDFRKYLVTVLLDPNQPTISVTDESGASWSYPFADHIQGAETNPSKVGDGLSRLIDAFEKPVRRTAFLRRHLYKAAHALQAAPN